MGHADESRVKQVLVAAAILLGIGMVMFFSLMTWSKIPGALGEWLGTMLGIMTTPFFMESSFIMLGLFIVISLNVWRRHREGDELVYLEQVVGPDTPADLPDQARWAIYHQAPLTPVAPTALEQAEGAMAIGDFPAAIHWISTMDAKELRQPATLKLRLDLARATGRDDLAASLEKEIASISH